MWSSMPGCAAGCVSTTLPPDDEVVYTGCVRNLMTRKGFKRAAS